MKTPSTRLFLKYPYFTKKKRPDVDAVRDVPGPDILVADPDDVHKEVAGLTEEQEYPAGEWICRPDIPPIGMHFIQEGAVTIADAGCAHRGLLLGPGDTFGEYVLEPDELPSKHDPFPRALRALTHVKTQRLRRERYLRTDDWLKDIVKARTRLCAFLPQFMDALLGHDLFSCLSRSQILDLALLGEARHLFPVKPDADGKVKGDPCGPNERLWIAEGRISLYCGTAVTVDIAAGALIEKFASGSTISAASDKGAWVVRLKEGEVDEQIANAFGVALEGQTVKGKVIVMCASGDRERSGVTALGELLVETLKRDLPDRTFKFMPRTAKLPDVMAAATPPGVVVLDAPDWTDWSDKELEGLRDLTTKVVHLSESSFEAPPAFLREKPIVRCVLLDERGRDRTPDVFGTLPWVGPLWRRVRDKDRFDRQILSDPPPAYYPGTVRLLLTQWKKFGRVELGALPADDRETLSRLGRAVTDRRIGVALGGGGALGFAHIALLEALAHFEVPIDMISGVSFGSLVGAFYATSGLDGLERLKLQRRRLQAALLASSMVPPTVELYLLLVLLCTRLEEVPVPFFPVALNLETSEEFTPTVGSMARGIRMSSALPGMLTPYLSPARRLGAHGKLVKDIPKRLVDGTTVNNVPEGILVREGADFIIASDVIALPPPPESLIPQVLGLPKLIPPVADVIEAGLLGVGSLLGGFVGTAWPFARMKDTMRSMSYLTRVADDRDADFANKRFRPPTGAFAMWDFSRAEKIMDNSREAAITFARDVKQEWLERDDKRTKVAADNGLNPMAQ